MAEVLDTAPSRPSGRVWVWSPSEDLKGAADLVLEGERLRLRDAEERMREMLNGLEGVDAETCSALGEVWQGVPRSVGGAVLKRPVPRITAEVLAEEAEDLRTRLTDEEARSWAVYRQSPEGRFFFAWEQTAALILAVVTVRDHWTGIMRSMVTAALAMGLGPDQAVSPPPKFEARNWVTRLSWLLFGIVFFYGIVDALAQLFVPAERRIGWMWDWLEAFEPSQWPWVIGVGAVALGVVVSHQNRVVTEGSQAMVEYRGYLVEMADERKIRRQLLASVTGRVEWMAGVDADRQYIQELRRILRTGRLDHPAPFTLPELYVPGVGADEQRWAEDLVAAGRDLGLEITPQEAGDGSDLYAAVFDEFVLSSMESQRD